MKRLRQSEVVNDRSYFQFLRYTYPITKHIPFFYHRSHISAWYANCTMKMEYMITSSTRFISRRSGFSYNNRWRDTPFFSLEPPYAKWIYFLRHTLTSCVQRSKMQYISLQHKHEKEFFYSGWGLGTLDSFSSHRGLAVGIKALDSPILNSFYLDWVY